MIFTITSICTETQKSRDASVLTLSHPHHLGLLDSNMALALRAGWGASSSSTSSPFIAALQNGLQTLFQSPASLIELLPPILLAVPKSRVSHSRKRMRAANKHLKEKDSESILPWEFALEVYLQAH